MNLISNAIFLGIVAGFVPSPHTHYCHEITRSKKPLLLFYAILIGIFIDLFIIFTFKLIEIPKFMISSILIIGIIYFIQTALKLLKATDSKSSFAFSLKNCAKSHLLNPNPYLFWLFIGAIYLKNINALMFVSIFLSVMVISKLLHILILLIVEKKLKKANFIGLRNKFLSVAFLFLSIKFCIKSIEIIL